MAYDLTVFFEVVGREPAVVTAADVFAFLSAQRAPRRPGRRALPPAQLDAITGQAADNDPALIAGLPYAPGFLPTAPDPVKENLYAALGIQCVYRPGKKQFPVRATMTNSTPGIVAALLADPRTGSSY